MERTLHHNFKVLKASGVNKNSFNTCDLFIFVCLKTREELIPMLEAANITIIAAESFKNDPASSVKYLLKVNEEGANCFKFKSYSQVNHKFLIPLRLITE